MNGNVSLIPGYISFVSGVSLDEIDGVLILTGQLPIIVRYLEPDLPVF